MVSKIFKSPLPVPSLPTGLNLPAFLRSTLTDEFLDKPAQVCADSKVEYTFRQVIDLDLRLASALRDGGFGLEHGNRIALFLPTVPEYLAIVLGVLDAGMVTVHFNPDYTEFEIAPLMEGIPISATICTASNYDRLKPVLSKFEIKTVITVGPNDFGAPNYFDLVKKHEPLKHSGPWDDNETALICFSSGTTGLPKGVATSHRNFIAQLTMSRVLECDTLYREETTFLPFNAFHAGGITIRLQAFDRKWKSVGLQSRLSLDKFETILKEFKPTKLWGVTTILSMVCALDNLTEHDFAQVKSFTFGGGCIDAELLKRLRGKVGDNVTFYTAYGLSEMSGWICLAELDERKIGKDLHCGKLVPGVELKVVNPSTGITCNENEFGELCFRGAMAFKGYANNQKAYEDSFKDGWFHTGDLGYIDEEGLLYIVGRIKEMIKVHGYQVAPEEIENIIKKHELVDQALVFGVPDSRTQEAPRAWIVPKSDTLTENDIHEFLKDKLIYYKQLRGGMRFVKSLPTTPGVNKLSRKAAKEMDATMAKEDITTEK